MSQDSTNIYVSKSNVIPTGDKEDAQWFDPCSGSSSEFTGIWKYRNLRSQGVLVEPTVAGNGWSRYWDDASQTPWLFNPSTNVFISYEDIRSFRNKVAYGKQKGLRGTMTWAFDEDINDERIDVLQDFNKESPEIEVESTKSEEETKKSGGLLDNVFDLLESLGLEL